MKPIRRTPRRNRGYISQRITQFLLRSAIKLLKFLTGLGRVVFSVLTIVCIQPLRLVGRFFIHATLPLYRLGIAARNRSVAPRPGASKPTLLSLLTSRYLVHGTVLFLTMSVALNNVGARGAGIAEVAGDSVLSRVVSANPEQEDIVEAAPAPRVAYIKRANAISPEANSEAELGTSATSDQAITASGNALQTSTIDPDTEQRSDVTTYVVRAGDTIGGIANRFSVTQRTILAANKLTNGDFIKPGQELLIPPITGVLHKVVRGDTIAAIAQKYKVDPEEILDFNHLADASAISVDQTLIVPGGEIPQIVPQHVAPRGQAGQPSYGGPVPGPAPAIGGGRLNWPTIGRRVNQYFRYGHTGIDAECKWSNPLFAAREGTVEGVFYQRYGYGYHILVNHGGGLETLYGHASKIFVKPGQRVSRGQSIAMCGTTGRSSGTHVHFETIVNGRKVNPLTYL